MGRNQGLTPGIVLIGDSIMALNQGPNVGVNESDRGFYNWSESFTGQAIPIVANVAIGGLGCASIQSQELAQALAYKTQYVMVMCGTNDLSSSNITPALAALQAMYDAVLANGSKLIIAAVPPNAQATVSPWIANYATFYNTINAYAKSHSNVIYAPMAEAIWTSLANPVPIANAMIDGVHPTRLGAALMGKALADAINTTVDKPTPPDLITKNTYDGNLLANGLMTGTGGTLGAGASGSVATSWTLASAGGASSVGSKVARTNVPSGCTFTLVPCAEWQQIVHIGIASPQNGAITTLTASTTDFAVGQTVQISVEWQVGGDWVNMERFDAYANFVGGNTASIKLINPDVTDATYFNNFPNNTSGVWRSLPFVITAGTNAITLSIEIAGQSGTVWIGRVQIEQVVPAAHTKNQIGLGNVENTALSAWTGSANLVQMGNWTCSASPTICLLYDSTPSTGKSTLQIKAGPGQSSTRLFQIKNSSNVELDGIGTSGAYEGVGFYENDDKMFATNGAMAMSSDYKLLWNTGASQGGTRDLGLARNAGGVLENRQRHSRHLPRSPAPSNQPNIGQHRHRNDESGFKAGHLGQSERGHGF